MRKRGSQCGSQIVVWQEVAAITASERESKKKKVAVQTEPVCMRCNSDNGMHCCRCSVYAYLLLILMLVTNQPLANFGARQRHQQQAHVNKQLLSIAVLDVCCTIVCVVIYIRCAMVCATNIHYLILYYTKQSYTAAITSPIGLQYCSVLRFMVTPVRPAASRLSSQNAAAAAAASTAVAAVAVTAVASAFQSLQQHESRIKVYILGANAATPIRQAASTSSTVNLAIVQMCFVSSVQFTTSSRGAVSWSVSNDVGALAE
eukprot:14620-Heterococcus_DN1.PRE.1